MPSVTQVIANLDKPALVYWAAGQQLDEDIETAWQLNLMHQQLEGASRESFDTIFRGRAGAEKAFAKASQKSKDLGNEVHLLIRHHLMARLGEKADPPEVCDAALYVFAGFETWAKQVAMQPLAFEQMLFSASGQWAGTLDCLAIVEGNLEVIDWKTTKKRVEKPYPEHVLQNVAYRNAAEEMGLPSCRGRIVYIPKVEGFEIESYPVVADPAEAMRAFDGLRAVHGWLKTG